MKAIVTALFTISFIIGCGKDDSAKPSQKSSTADSNFMMRGEFENESQKELEANQAVLKVLLDKASQASDKEVRKAKIDRTVEVKARAESLQFQLDTLKTTPNAQWLARRQEFERSFSEFKESVKALKERQDFEDGVQAKMQKIQLKIDQLKEDTKSATAAAKKELGEQVDKLEAKKNDLDRDFHEFQLAAKDKWQNFKSKFSDAFEDLSAAFKGLFD